MPDLAPEDIPLFLDGKTLGTTADTEQLDSWIKSLMPEPDPAANTNANSNAATSKFEQRPRLILYFNANIRMNTYAAVADKVHWLFYDRMTIWRGTACSSGNPPVQNTVFVLSDTKISEKELENIKTNSACSFGAEMVLTESHDEYSNRLVKSHRLSYTSFEISASGTYLLNAQPKLLRNRISTIANMDSTNLRRRVDAARVEQRPIDSTSLGNEVAAWLKQRISEGSSEFLWENDGTVLLPIIVDGNASYASLLGLLRHIDHPKIKLKIIVHGVERKPIDFPPPPSANLLN